MSPQDREEALTLEILNAIEARSDVTQRHLADRLGVALGLANSYLKRCVRKGLVKITQAPANRYLYYLTPQGFTEKSRLTGQYLFASLDFYRRAGASMERALAECEARGARRVLFAGVSELAEIAAIRGQDVALEIVGTFDPNGARANFVGKPVWQRLADAPAWDVVLVTAYENAPAMFGALSSVAATHRIVVPDIVASLATFVMNSHAIAPSSANTPDVAYGLDERQGALDTEAGR
jgi:DNA-binding MarR family transcriptional regulator